MRDMLEPMSTGEFFSDYYMQEPVHIHRVRHLFSIFVFFYHETYFPLVHYFLYHFLACNIAHPDDNCL